MHGSRVYRRSYKDWLRKKRNVRVNMRMISDMQLIGGYAYVVATTHKIGVGN